MRKLVNVTWRTPRGVTTETVWLVGEDELIGVVGTGVPVSTDGQSALTVNDILDAAEDFVAFEDDAGIFMLEAVCILGIEDA